MMAKISITIEDCTDGIVIVGDPSMQDLSTKARTAPRSLTIGERLALAAWAAIAEAAASVGTVQTGERH